MSIIFLFFLSSLEISSNTLLKGEKLFESNCLVCHPGGNNIIIPEKNLKKENLEANGMNSKSSIIYQLTNGKNGMPAFGDRLIQQDIEKISDYILFQSKNNFEKNENIY